MLLSRICIAASSISAISCPVSTPVTGIFNSWHRCCVTSSLLPLTIFTATPLCASAARASAAPAFGGSMKAAQPANTSVLSSRTSACEWSGGTLRQAMPVDSMSVTPDTPLKITRDVLAVEARLARAPRSLAQDPWKVRAWQSCTYKMITVRPDASVSEVAGLMVEKSLHYVVVTEDADIQGMLSSLDFVRIFISSPSVPPRR